MFLGWCHIYPQNAGGMVRLLLLHMCLLQAFQDVISTFQNTLIRLFSLLHAAALAEIEDTSAAEPGHIEAFGFNLLDDIFVDDDSLVTLRDSHCKLELVFQWIQQLIRWTPRDLAWAVWDGNYEWRR